MDTRVAVCHERMIDILARKLEWIPKLREMNYLKR